MKLLTVKEVAEILNVKQKTLYQWVELGQIPAYKLNGCVRFDLGDIEKWIADCKRKPDSDYNVITKLEAQKGGKYN